MRTLWLAALMLLSVIAVGLLALWDEGHEAAAALDDFAAEQSTLAAVAGAGLSTQIDGVRRDAIATAAETAEGRPVPSPIADNYVTLHVRAAGDPSVAPTSGPPDWQAIDIQVPVSDGRIVELMVPMVRLIPGDNWLEHTDGLVLVLPPHERKLRRTDGQPVDAPEILAALDASQRSLLISRPAAAALGLPARLAVAGISTVNASPLGSWGVVVVTSAERVRDREARARLRLVLGMAVVVGLVLAFGGAALHMQRKELDLERALAVADLQRTRDAELARESRAAMMLTLAAGVAHEVSTPLSVISGRAEQLASRGQEGDERSQRAIQLILEQADRIREVVRGFLRLARGDTPVLDRVDSASVVATGVALVEHRFTDAGVGLTVDYPDHPPLVRGDANLLEQALCNLLLNACDACERGGRVEVKVEATGDQVTFAVVDDGSGISPENAARVVEPFFSTKPGDKGTGLGLAIANEIAKIHRGALTLEPRVPHGTRAAIRVPVEEESHA